jgi:MoaA/NifB/PqqE/SkfB family radical SAM enzyme
MPLTPAEAASRERLKLYKPLVYAKVIHYEEKLARGESVAAMDVQYSFLCNLHCTHCLAEDLRQIKRPQLNPDDIANLCNQADALGLAHFCLTGGEPLAFPDLVEVLGAINTQHFFVQIDSNGWLMTQKKAEQLKYLGVDRIQLSLDGSDAQEHDAFRNKPGSYQRVLKAIEHIKAAGLRLQIGTVVTHERAQSAEFEHFLDMTDAMGAVVAIQYPKLSGAWKNRTDLLLTAADMAYLRGLEKRHNVNGHLTGGYGLGSGCLRVRKILTINAWGDATPCAGTHHILGNIRTTPLADILALGMREYGTCREYCSTGEYERYNMLDE